MSPILVHTVLEGELYETASLDAGADDYIVKKAPISILPRRYSCRSSRASTSWSKESAQDCSIPSTRSMAAHSLGIRQSEDCLG
jgi:DNA-binding response OmpR family regulator